MKSQHDNPSHPKSNVPVVKSGSQHAGSSSDAKQASTHVKPADQSMRGSDPAKSATAPIVASPLKGAAPDAKPAVISEPAKI